MASSAITVDLNARIAQFETDMKRATGTLNKFGKSAGVLKAGLGGLFAGVGVAGLVSFAKNGIDAADALKDMSDRLGVSVKDLASFRLAAEQSGTDLEGVAKGIAMLTRSIGEAEAGNKGIAKSLVDLGITARDPKEAFFQLADAVEKTQDPSKRAVLLNDVLKRGYGDLIPLLSQGGTELRKLAQESETYAQTMARLAPDADKFNDEMARLKLEAAGASGALLTRLVPGLTETAKRVRELLDEDKGIQALARAIAGLGKLPFDAILGDVKVAGTAAERIKEMRGELGKLEKLKNTGEGSIIDRIFSTPAVLDQRIRVLKNQIVAFEKFGEKIYGKKDAKPKTTPGGIDLSAANDKPKGVKAGKASDPAGDFVKKLREEAATLGLSGEALQRYEALKLKLTGSNAKLADSYITQIAAFKAQQEIDEKINSLTEQKIALQGSALKGIKDYISEQAFEASLLGKTNAERDVAIQLRASETAGINTQTEAYKKFREQLTNISESNQLQSLLKETDFEKIKTDQADAILLTKAFTEGIRNANGELIKLGNTEYIEVMAKRFGLIGEKISEMSDFAKTAAKNIQQSMADFLFDPFDKKMGGILKNFGLLMKRMVAEAVAADLAKRMFGGLSDGGKTGGSGWIGGALELFGGLFASGSANGNAFSASGAKLPGFANGGVVSGPTSGYPVLMHGTEGVLPLKRGANGKLGVENFGGGGNITVIVNGSNNAPDVRRAAGQGAREALGMFSAAKRYA